MLKHNGSATILPSTLGKIVYASTIKDSSQKMDLSQIPNGVNYYQIKGNQ
jgi:hypothetical protein